MKPEQRLARYTAVGNRRVQGWLSPGAISLIMGVDQVQKELGVRGRVAEIGVHHGRLFLLLCLLTREGENAVAVDLFQDQALNVDSSGKGDREAFLENVRAHLGEAPRLRVLHGDSLTLGPGDIEAAAGGKVRLFSVDGGHTARHTRHDLATAAGSLCEGGIAILDDYFNEEWPGVSEGANRFFTETGGQGLAPFAIGGGKLLFAKGADFANTYTDRLIGRGIGAEWKRSELFGYPVICYSFAPISLKRRLARAALWQGVRANRLGRFLKKLAGRYWAN